MSNASKTKYWYFRFTKNFFQDKTIRDLKYIPVYGYQFGWIYLEMCTLCLWDGDSYLKIPRYTPADNYVTYIANQIGEDPKIVQQAISYFISHGYIELIERDMEYSLEFKQMKANIGKSSVDADRKRLEQYERKLLEDRKVENTTDEESENIRNMLKMLGE